MTKRVHGYQRVESIEGDPAPALKTARTVLLHHGYRIRTLAPGEIEASGGPWMNSSSQPGLIGASVVRASVTPTSVSVTAELGNLRRFLLLMDLSLLGMFLLMSYSLYKGGYSGVRLATPLLVLVPIPFLAYWTKSRTLKALNTLVLNMVDAANNCGDPKDAAR